MKSLILNIFDSISYPLCLYPDVLSPETIRKLVGKDDPVILEIGANDGTDTEKLLEQFKNPMIYCFDPEPRAIKSFRKKFDGNPKVKLFEFALSNKNGKTDFFRSDTNQDYLEKGIWPANWDKSGSIKAPGLHLEIHPYINFDNKITIETKRLDDWCKEERIKNIDFVWMDVQGAEKNVLLGAKESLKNIRYLYTEYSNKQLYKNQTGLQGILRILKTYKVITRFPNDVLLENSSV